MSLPENGTYKLYSIVEDVYLVHSPDDATEVARSGETGAAYTVSLGSSSVDRRRSLSHTVGGNQGSRRCIHDHQRGYRSSTQD
jgi:hypothetical protein